MVFAKFFCPGESCNISHASVTCSMLPVYGISFSMMDTWACAVRRSTTSVPCLLFYSVQPRVYCVCVCVRVDACVHGYVGVFVGSSPAIDTARKLVNAIRDKVQARDLEVMLNELDGTDG